jgi:hypothetical protein
MQLSKEKGVRGNNRIAKALNKPIGGSLSKKVSIKGRSIIFLIVFFAILYYSISQLGFKTGFLVAIGFSLSGIAAYFMSEHQRKEIEKFRGKHRRTNTLNNRVPEKGRTYEKIIIGLLGIAIGGGWFLGTVEYFEEQGITAIGMPLILIMLGAIYLIGGIKKQT